MYKYAFVYLCFKDDKQFTDASVKEGLNQTDLHSDSKVEIWMFLNVNLLKK